MDERAKITRRSTLAALSALGLAACGKSGFGNEVIPAAIDSQSLRVAGPPRLDEGQPDGEYRIESAGMLASAGIRHACADETSALYIGTSEGDLLWYRDLAATPAGQASSGLVQFANGGVGSRIGTSWQQFSSVAYAGGGIMYALRPSGDLLFYQDIARDGANQWARGSGTVVGRGWKFQQIFAGSTGVIFAIDPRGDLYLFRTGGTSKTQMPSSSGQKIGSGWNAFTHVVGASDGVVYAYAASGQLFWFRFVLGGSTPTFNASSGLLIATLDPAYAQFAADMRGNIYGISAQGDISRWKDLSRSGARDFDALGGQPIGSGWDLYAPIRGYCVPMCASPGQTVEFKVSTRRYTTQYKATLIKLHRNGTNNGVQVEPSFTLRAEYQSVPTQPWAKSHNWSTSYRYKLPANLASGLYALVVVDAISYMYLSFVVRPAAGYAVTKQFAVLSSTNTWNAYNDWGGRSQYTLPNATPLSFERPFPNVGPYFPRIPHLAFAEVYMLDWLSAKGFSYDVYSDFDMHDGIAGLHEYRGLILNTHPEYWTLEMRQNLTAYIKSGGTVFYIGGNGIYERVQYSSDQKSLIMRQGNATNPRWTFASQGLPEQELLGVGYVRDSWNTFAPYRVLMPNHPFFNGATVRAGDLIGKSGLAGFAASGYEADAIGEGSPANVQVLAQGTNTGRDGVPNQGGMITYYRTGHGGFVFSVGSTMFGQSLPTDPVLQTVIENALWTAIERTVV